MKNEPINQSINRPKEQSITQSINQSIKRLTKQAINRRIKVTVYRTKSPSAQSKLVIIVQVLQQLQKGFYGKIVQHEAFFPETQRLDVPLICRQFRLPTLRFLAAGPAKVPQFRPAFSSWPSIFPVNCLSTPLRPRDRSVCGGVRLENVWLFVPWSASSSCLRLDPLQLPFLTSSRLRRPFQRPCICYLSFGGWIPWIPAEKRIWKPGLAEERHRRRRQCSSLWSPLHFKKSAWLREKISKELDNEFSNFSTKQSHRFVLSVTTCRRNKTANKDARKWHTKNFIQGA